MSVEGVLTVATTPYGILDESYGMFSDLNVDYAMEEKDTVKSGYGVIRGQAFVRQPRKLSFTYQPIANIGTADPVAAIQGATTFTVSDPRASGVTWVPTSVKRAGSAEKFDTIAVEATEKVTA